jgi:hypothetical protein
MRVAAVFLALAMAMAEDPAPPVFPTAFSARVHEVSPKERRSRGDLALTDARLLTGCEG